MIKLQNTSYSYGKRFSLENVSLDIPKGSITILLGPNGSGKTTLLNLVSGGLLPQSGKVLIDNQNVSHMKSRVRAKNIAVVRQFVSAPFNYSVFDIVSMGRYAYKRRFETLNSDDIKIVRLFMKELGIDSLQDEYVSKISGGELQRVSLARALSQQSEYLLLDEPVNHLDIRHRYDILNIIKNRSEQGLTTLCVLHDINLAMQYADQLVLMKEGKVLDILTPKQINKAKLSALYDVTEQELATMIFDKSI
ncbi:MAG: ABC transporter ATP-binding protein [Clostridiales bacterium]|nr:ABC transporter ATP-binding protein [Clostridiales bacterium]